MAVVTFVASQANVSAFSFLVTPSYPGLDVSVIGILNDQLSFFFFFYNFFLFLHRTPSVSNVEYFFPYNVDEYTKIFTFPSLFHSLLLLFFSSSYTA